MFTSEFDIIGKRESNSPLKLLIKKLLNARVEIKFVMMTKRFNQYNDNIYADEYNNLKRSGGNLVGFKDDNDDAIYQFEMRSDALLIKSVKSGKFLGARSDYHYYLVNATYDKYDSNVLEFDIGKTSDNKYFTLCPRHWANEHTYGWLWTNEGWNNMVAYRSNSTKGSDTYNQRAKLFMTLRISSIKSIMAYYRNLISDENSELKSVKSSYKTILGIIKDNQQIIDEFVLEKEEEIGKHKEAIKDEINGFAKRLELEKQKELDSFKANHNITKLKTFFTIMSKKYESEANDSIIANIDYKAIFTKINTEHQANLKEINDKYQPKIDSLVTRIGNETTALNKLNNDHQAKMTKINNDYKKKVADITKDFNSDVAIINNNIKSINGKISKAQAAYLETLNKTQAEYDAEKKRLNNELIKENNKYTELVKNNEIRIAELDEKNEQTIDKMIDDYEAIFKSIKEDISKSEDLMTQLKANYTRDINILEREFQLTIVEVNDRIKKYENDTQTLLKNTKLAIKEFRREQDKLIEAYKIKVKGDKEKLAEEMILKVEQHKTKLVNEKIDKIKDEEIQKLNSEYKMLEEKRKKLITEYKKIQNEIYSKKYNEIATIVELTKNSVMEKNEEIKKLNSEIKTLNSEQEALNEKYKEKRNKLLNSHALKMARNKDEYDKIYNKLSRDLNELEQEMQNKLNEKENKLNNLSKQHNNKMLQNTIDIDKMRNIHNDNIISYQKQLNYELDVYLRKLSEERESITKKEMGQIVESTVLEMKQRDDRMRLLKREINFLEIEKKELEKMDNILKSAVANEMSTTSIILMVLSGLLLTSGMYYFFIHPQ